MDLHTGVLMTGRIAVVTVTLRWTSEGPKWIFVVTRTYIWTNTWVNLRRLWPLLDNIALVLRHQPLSHFLFNAHHASSFLLLLCNEVSPLHKLIGMYQLLNIIFLDNIQSTSPEKRRCRRNITPRIINLGAPLINWSRHYIKLTYKLIAAGRAKWVVSKKPTQEIVV